MGKEETKEDLIKLSLLLKSFTPKGLDYMYSEQIPYYVDRMRIHAFTLQFLFQHPEVSSLIYNNKRYFAEALPLFIKTNIPMYDLIQSISEALKDHRKHQKQYKLKKEVKKCGI